LFATAPLIKGIATVSREQPERFSPLAIDSFCNLAD
jgi:hypothetical protein